jgi:hypothetical protein
LVSLADLLDSLTWLQQTRTTHLNLLETRESDLTAPRFLLTGFNLCEDVWSNKTQIQTFNGDANYRWGSHVTRGRSYGASTTTHDQGPISTQTVELVIPSLRNWPQLAQNPTETKQKLKAKCKVSISGFKAITE